MNLQNICDVTQSIALGILCITCYLQYLWIRELEENALEMTKAIISTRRELDLPLFPEDPEEDEE